MPDLSASNLYVIIPDANGTVTVASVADLAISLDDGDMTGMDDVLLNAGFDELPVATPAALAELVAAVSRLNATGDLNAYWSDRGF